jgi:hypothetical protein
MQMQRGTFISYPYLYPPSHGHGCQFRKRGTRRFSLGVYETGGSPRDALQYTEGKEMSSTRIPSAGSENSTLFLYSTHFFISPNGIIDRIVKKFRHQTK